MPNREWSRLTPTQAAAVERCIAKALQERGQHSEETEGGKAYAYSKKGDRIAWGLNAPNNVARGAVPR
jgi:surface antigen